MNQIRETKFKRHLSQREQGGIHSSVINHLNVNCLVQVKHPFMGHGKIQTLTKDE